MTITQKTRGINISLLTLGCPKNQVDSENLVNKLIGNGFSIETEPEEADILLINTCGFIEDAKKESIDEILRLSALKKNGKKLLVFGCLAQRYKNELMREMPEIDAIYGIEEEDAIIDYCTSTATMIKRAATCKNGALPRTIKKAPKTPYAYVKIAEGCNKKCSFCVIPSIRGPFRSFSPDIILEEAEKKIRSGIKELILIAQDTAAYEFKGYSLSHLLKDIASIKGDFYMRLLYLYPTSINDALLQVVSSEDKIYKYLDIPLQHSEDRMLRLMGRRGTKREYLKLISKARHMIPGIALRTTFIAGFPRETEEDFQNMIDFIKEVRFDSLGVFKYSMEEGTPAYRFKGHLPASLKEKRFDEIMKHQSQISLEKNQELIGRRFRAVVDEIDNANAIGRIYSQSPEIDGVTFIDLQQYHIDQKSPAPFLDIEITDALDYDLKGIVLENEQTV